MKSIALIVLLAVSHFALGADAPPPPPGADVTPPRLSFVDGKVSFWRPGAEDWAPARVNTPLAAGDALYAAARANLEMQIGARAFARAAENTQLGIVNIEPDFLQLKVTSGQASVDLRSVAAGHTVELDTPNAVFTIERPGYYRVAVIGDTTHFITRRGGRATVMLAEGVPQTVYASEEIVVRGTAEPTVETYAAPELDAWDRWNYARTDHEIEALSARYVSAGVYGVGVLDQWGAWRVVQPYGAVWIPERVPSGWAPYTAGSWIWDVRFGWTWVDEAPWGWAPFHHGRWVVVNGFWAWAPGPVIMQPVYAPALVAFFSLGADVSVSIGISGPAFSWVALAWGEPLVPWWGRPGFVGVPWWGGWGGPRVVNNVVIERTTVVNVNTIVHQHTRTPRAVAAVPQRLFGSGPVRATRLAQVRTQELARLREAPPVRPGAASLVPERRATVRPPANVASRPVMATRPSREAPAQAKVIAPPKQPEAGAPAPRPSFGERGVERARPSAPPRLEDLRRASPVARPAPPAQQTPAKVQRAPAKVQQAPARVQQPRALPGRPANESLPRQAQASTKARGKAGAPQREAPSKK
jgi:hypothetical protein